MRRDFTAAEAKARFADCLSAAERGEPTVITRHGKPVAALVRVSDLDNLERLRAVGSEGGLASVAGGWEGSESLAAVVQSQRRSRPRPAPAR